MGTSKDEQGSMSWTTPEDVERLVEAERNLLQHKSVPLTEIERILLETSQYFAGDHVNADAVVWNLRYRIHEYADATASARS